MISEYVSFYRGPSSPTFSTATTLSLRFLPRDLRPVEGARLRLLAEGRLVRDGGRPRLRTPPAILEGKVS